MIERLQDHLADDPSGGLLTKKPNGSGGFFHPNHFIFLNP
jgi:hypothetical protein